jgi:hypothetical protein
MDPVIREIKWRLKKAGQPQLRVQFGRGTASNFIGVHRKDFDSFNKKEGDAIKKVFGEKYNYTNTNAWHAWSHIAKMKLGMIPRKPFCDWCGTTFEKEKDANTCSRSH